MDSSSLVDWSASSRKHSPLTIIANADIVPVVTLSVLPTSTDSSFALGKVDGTDTEEKHGFLKYGYSYGTIADLEAAEPGLSEILVCHQDLVKLLTDPSTALDEWIRQAWLLLPLLFPDFASMFKRIYNPSNPFSTINYGLIFANVCELP